MSVFSIRFSICHWRSGSMWGCSRPAWRSSRAWPSGPKPEVTISRAVPTRSLGISCGRAVATPPSGKAMVPESTPYSPEMTLSRVDLPAPLRPSTQTRSPRSRWRLAFSRTAGPLKLMVRSVMLRTGIGAKRHDGTVGARQANRKERGIKRGAVGSYLFCNEESRSISLHYAVRLLAVGVRPCACLSAGTLVGAQHGF